MSAGKLITELFEETVGLIVEQKGGEKKYFFEGIFIQAEKKNRNGRIYNRKMLEEEVNNYINEKVLTNRAVGELGHPATPTINYDRVSHQIIALEQQGNDWYGKAKVLTSLPMGKIVQGLIDEGVKFGTSTRGVGVLRPNKALNVTEVFNYKLATAGDVVSDPSAPDAFVRGVMEGAEFIYDAATDSFAAVELLEKIENKFKSVKHTQITEEQKLNAFNAFLKTL